MFCQSVGGRSWNIQDHRQFWVTRKLHIDTRSHKFVRQIGRGSTTPITITKKMIIACSMLPLRVNKRCVPIFLCVYSRMQKRTPINIKCRGEKLPRKPQLGHNEGLTSRKQETRNANWLCTHVSTEFDIKLFSPARKNKDKNPTRKKYMEGNILGGPKGTQGSRLPSSCSRKGTGYGGVNIAKK